MVIGGKVTWWCRWFGCRWQPVGRRFRMCVRRGCTRFEEIG